MLHGSEQAAGHSEAHLSGHAEDPLVRSMRMGAGASEGKAPGGDATELEVEPGTKAALHQAQSPVAQSVQELQGVRSSTLPPLYRDRMQLGTATGKDHDYLSLGLSLQQKLPTMSVGSTALRGVRSVHGAFGGDKSVASTSIIEEGSGSVAPRDRHAIQEGGLAATVRAAAALESKMYEPNGE